VRTLITLLPALVCGAMMLVCARMMFGRHGQTHDDPRTREIAELRDELSRLRAERDLQEREEKING
jgi:hypothetical protein